MKTRMKTRKELEAIVGGLSKPSKMPCHGYSLPARKCKVGSQLRKMKNSTCSNCYAMKGRYVFPNVAEALERRFQSMMDMDLWTESMIELISRFEKSGYFRWHDSGDIQGTYHLRAIVKIAEAVPHIQFWLPTRELGILREYVEKHGGFPENLTVRVSSHWVGSAMSLPHVFIDAGVVLSTVGCAKATQQLSDRVHQCPASRQGNTCGDCRACWKRDTACVDYPLH